MKISLRTFLAAFIISLPTLLFSQDLLYRGEYPLAVKLGFGGVGVDIAAGDHVGIDATSWILASSFSARYYLLEKNGSPFIGIGVGTANGGFGGNGQNQWTVGFIGWEHSYNVVLIQMSLQIPIVQRYSYGFSPFIVNLNVGARIH